MRIAAFGSALSGLLSLLVRGTKVQVHETRHGTRYQLDSGDWFEIVDYRIPREGKAWHEIFKKTDAVLVAVDVEQDHTSDMCDVESIRSSYWLSDKKIIVVFANGSSQDILNHLNVKGYEAVSVYQCEGGDSILDIIKQTTLVTKCKSVSLRISNSEPSIPKMCMLEPRYSQ